ncbi:MAG: preprotein translocase subunit SecY [Candidatus Gygaella obscura]|nr:preprotein translocase subunit SecY [Candidatus Gygaella obscura]
MLKALINSFKIADLKKKILITLGLLIIYRMGCYIPTPGIDGAALSEFFRRMTQAQGASIFGIINMFSGGALEQMTIFALGIMPYISASIIMQLLTAVIPSLEKLAKEGRVGHEKINQYTRIGTLFLCLVQAFFISMWLENPSRFQGLQIVPNPGLAFRVLTVLTLTTGTMFIMWLGEQIQERGIGNGISLIIAVGIISRLPTAIYQLFVLASPFSPEKRSISPIVIVVIFAIMFALIAFVVMITQGQRKIPVQYARRIVGRKLYGGQSTYLPIKVDTAGVISIIFAQSIILFPATIATFMPHAGFQKITSFLIRGNIVYNALYAVLIVFFCYFYTAIVFNPVEIAENMKKYGGFIPGIRPGKPTADFLIFVLNRITLVGALSIVFVAIFPDFVIRWLKVPYSIASFLGGTTILIVVGVMLDTLKQIESQLLMHHYEGFMKTGQIKGRR